MVRLYGINPMVRCFLVLENGTVLEGVSFGHESAVLDEMIFTTCMSGYQEYLTDPAYEGKILVSAFPLIGDYGVNDRYSQSDRVHASGLVVREYSEDPTDMYGGRTLHEYLKKNKVPGISGVDTRDIIRMIRREGAMGAAVVYDEKEIDAAKKKLKENREDDDLVKLVSPKKKKIIDNGKGIKLGVIDCGMRRSMINDLSEDYDLVVFPYDAKAKEITDSGVSGLVISHGPGNPAHPDIMNSVVRTVKELSSKMPMAGVSFGAQVIALAFGCGTVKLKFGHNGGSQPVKYGDRVHITSQNHMYSVDPDSLKGTGLKMDQVNVNDGTLEGFSHTSLPVFGIQYDPASPKYEKDSFFYEKLKKVTGGGK